MRRELPTHPHIDHLKKQAKDLLDGHKRADPEALARIVASLPSFSGRSPDQAAALDFALHDAQSTIAREYGFHSWSELRAEVEKRASSALPDSFIRGLTGRPLPPEVTAALTEAWDSRDGASELASRDLPRQLPLVAFRDALLTPGAVAPMMLGRASSQAAVGAALATNPALLAVFSQRSAQVEEPGLEDLYPVGCVALVHRRVPDEAHAFLVVQGLLWASLEKVDPAGARQYAVAHVAPFRVVVDQKDQRECETLRQALRDRALLLAAAMPQRARVVALIDSIRGAERLADLVVANLPCPVVDKARYAAEPSMTERLRTAIALCDAELAQMPK
jgi:hypothetical protein